MTKSEKLKLAHKKKAWGFIKGKKGFWSGKKGTYKNPLERNRKISESLRGDRAHSWKGGISPFIQQIRHCFRYRQWVADCLTRDNYTCVICNKRGGDLEVDHYPKMFSKVIEEYKIKSVEESLRCEELWNMNNGRTLCVLCHRKTFKQIYEK